MFIRLNIFRDGFIYVQYIIHAICFYYAQLLPASTRASVSLIYVFRKLNIQELIFYEQDMITIALIHLVISEILYA